MNRAAVTVLLLALSQLVPLPAQTKPENNLSPRMRVYEPKYLKGDRAEQVSRFVSSVVGSVSINWEPVVNGLVIHSNIPDDIDKAEALLKRFDVPAPPPPAERQIEMTIHLIRASAGATGVPSSVPPELEPVVKEMKGSLTYTGFSLVDTMVVNVRDEMKLDDLLPNSVTGQS